MLVTYDGLWQDLAARFGADASTIDSSVASVLLGRVMHADAWAPLRAGASPSPGEQAFVGAISGAAANGAPNGHAVAQVPCAASAVTAAAVWCSAARTVVALPSVSGDAHGYGNLTLPGVVILQSAVTVDVDFEAVCTFDANGIATVSLCRYGEGCRAVVNASAPGGRPWDRCSLTLANQSVVAALLSPAGASTLLHVSTAAWHLEGSGGHSSLLVATERDGPARFRSLSVHCESEQRPQWCVIAARQVDGTYVSSAVDVTPFLAHRSGGFRQMLGPLAGSVVGIFAGNVRASWTVVTSTSVFECSDLTDAQPRCVAVWSPVLHRRSVVVSATKHPTGLIAASQESHPTRSVSLVLLDSGSATQLVSNLLPDALAANAAQTSANLVSLGDAGVALSDRGARTVLLRSLEHWKGVGAFVGTAGTAIDRRALVRLSATSV
jgi:hypothetical protein